MHLWQHYHLWVPLIAHLRTWSVRRAGMWMNCLSVLLYMANYNATIPLNDAFCE